jgi:hypothetical protein
MSGEPLRGRRKEEGGHSRHNVSLSKQDGLKVKKFQKEGGNLSKLVESKIRSDLNAYDPGRMSEILLKWQEDLEKQKVSASGDPLKLAEIADLEADLLRQRVILSNMAPASGRCRYCGNLIQHRNATQFCSRNHYRAFFAVLFKGKVRRCEGPGCKNLIYVSKSKERAGMGIFCSSKCQHNYQRKADKHRKCIECGKRFEARSNRLETSWWHNRKCYEKWLAKHPEQSHLTKLTKEERSNYGKNRTPARDRQLKEIQEISHKLIKQARRRKNGRLLKRWNKLHS